MKLRKRVTSRWKWVERETWTRYKHSSPRVLFFPFSRECARGILSSCSGAASLSFFVPLVSYVFLPTSNLSAIPLGSAFGISRILPFVFPLLSHCHTNIGLLSALTWTIKITSFICLPDSPFPTQSLLHIATIVILQNKTWVTILPWPKPSSSFPLHFEWNIKSLLWPIMHRVVWNLVSFLSATLSLACCSPVTLTFWFFLESVRHALALGPLLLLLSSAWSVPSQDYWIAGFLTTFRPLQISFPWGDLFWSPYLKQYPLSIYLLTFLFFITLSVLNVVYLVVCLFPSLECVLHEGRHCLFCSLLLYVDNR